MTDTQPNEKNPEHEERHWVTKRVWFMLFLIGSITFVLAFVGTPFNNGLQGIAVTLTLLVPLYIGFPVILYSIVHAVVFRLKQQIHLSVMLLFAHILLFALNVLIGAIACC